jgi:hypothetical protein
MLHCDVANVLPPPTQHASMPPTLTMAVDSLLLPLATASEGTRMTEIEVKTMLHNLAAELIYQ